MTLAGEADVRVERRDGVLLLTLARPEVLNAIRTATVEALLAALDAAEAGGRVRAIAVAGAGRAFSSGVDLRELLALLESGEPPRAARARLKRLQALTRRIASHPVPVVAAVGGPAVGLAAELAVACDLRVVSRRAEFRFPEASRGLTPTNGVSWLLPRLVGRGRAADWLLTGRAVPADEALEAGLADRLVDPGDLLDSALALATRASAGAGSSVRSAKRLLAAAEREALEAALGREVEEALACMSSPAYEEGLRAFAEKRAPAYRGRASKPEPAPRGGGS